MSGKEGGQKRNTYSEKRRERLGSEEEWTNRDRRGGPKGRDYVSAEEHSYRRAAKNHVISEKGGASRGGRGK